MASDPHVEPHSFEDFQARLFALQDEMFSYGIVSAVAFMEDDPLARQFRANYRYKGSAPVAIGLLESMKASILFDRPAPRVSDE